MKKITISTSSFGEYNSLPLEMCEKAGFKIIINPYKRKVNPDELIEFTRESVGLIAGTESITKIVLSKLPYLKVISRCGAGIDNVDINAADKLGIEVFNTPTGPTLAVAELTIGLILNLLRKINKMNIDLKKGNWEKLMGNLLYGKKIGIVGFGRIGQKVGELIRHFGVELSYYDIESKICSFSCEMKTFEEIFKWADIITLHLPSSLDGSPIIRDKELRSMKRGSWLVNTSRGGIINEFHLYNLLRENYLSGAAIDVFEQEPYNGPLKNLDNVIITPHVGSYAKESRIEMERLSVENLLRGLKNG